MIKKKILKEARKKETHYAHRNKDNNATDFSLETMQVWEKKKNSGAASLKYKILYAIKAYFKNADEIDFSNIQKLKN